MKISICWSLVLSLAAAAQPPDQTVDEPASQPGNEIRRGLRIDEPPETRQRRFFERLAQELEPDLHGSPQKLDAYIRSLAQAIIHDRRIIAFDVSAKHGDGGIVLSGYVEYREHVDSLVSLFNRLGFARVTNSVVMLPDVPHPFAVVRATRAFIRSAPTEPREALNEVVHGEPIFVLASAKDSFLCHAPDGYVGWIDADDIEQIDPSSFDALYPAPRDPKRIDAILAAAKAQLGRPYVWGGRSDAGVDCSGLVQTSFASQGIHLPRDAEQQASVGTVVATRWHRGNLSPGDLLFFLGRRGNISHVAISLGGPQYIEASGKVKISSFDPQDANYEKRRDEGFCFARRVID
jgi:hypothetical protein